MILDAYLQKFAVACTKAGGWYGLDLFAGGGINWSEIREREISGSPLIGLDAKPPPATRLVACETNGKAFEALRHRTLRYGERADVLQQDANLAIDEILGRIPNKAPAFAFLDPEGSELKWETIEAIANHKRGASPWKVEQLILLPTDMGFVRLIPDYPEKVSGMYGPGDWQTIEQRRTAGKIDADQARGEYVQMYAKGLKDLGYETVLDRQIKKPNGSPMYFLLFATDHDAGERIMDHCFDRVRLRVNEELGQAQLFPVTDGPRPTRLGEN